MNFPSGKLPIQAPQPRHSISASLPTTGAGIPGSLLKLRAGLSLPRQDGDSSGLAIRPKAPKSRAYLLSYQGL